MGMLGGLVQPPHGNENALQNTHQSKIQYEFHAVFH